MQVYYYSLHPTVLALISKFHPGLWNNCVLVDLNFCRCEIVSRCGLWLMCISHRTRTCTRLMHSRVWNVKLEDLAFWRWLKQCSTVFDTTYATVSRKVNYQARRLHSGCGWTEIRRTLSSWCFGLFFTYFWTNDHLCDQKHISMLLFWGVETGWPRIYFLVSNKTTRILDWLCSKVMIMSILHWSLGLRQELFWWTSVKCWQSLAIYVVRSKYEVLRFGKTQMITLI